MKSTCGSSKETRAESRELPVGEDRSQSQKEKTSCVDNGATPCCMEESPVHRTISQAPEACNPCEGEPKGLPCSSDESCGAESSSSDATSSCEDKAKETPSCSDKSYTEKSEATPANPSCSEQTPADSCCPKPTSPKPNDENPTRACEPGPCSQGKPGDDPKGPSCSEPGDLCCARDSKTDTKSSVAANSPCCPEESPRVQPSCGEAADCCAGGVASESEPLLLGDGHAGKCCDKGDCSPANGPDEREAERKESVAVQICDDEDAEASESEPLVSKTAAKPTAIEIVEAEGDQLEAPRSPSNVPTTTKLRVPNICCAMEAKLVEDTLKPLHGVQSVSVNVIGRVAYVRHVPSLTSAADLVTVLNGVRLGASIMESGARGQGGSDAVLPRGLKLFGVYLLVQTALMLIAAVGFFMNTSWYMWVAIAEIVVGIAPILRKSFVSVKTCTLDINILMLIAVTGTLAIQEWLEGATVVFVYSVAEALEEFCMHKVQRTISGLMLKAPQMAVLAESGDCVRVEAVAIGTVIAVRPGELVPLDGVVVRGQAAVDESSISGEAVPVEKSVDSKVYSGTVNQNGYLEVKTTADASSSTVSKVADMVEEAQASSTQTEVVINRFAKFYTPLVVIIAVLVVAVPAILGASGVGTYLEDISEWGERALLLLVIACPCALVMATPIAIVCGITASARNGALVKGAVHLETLARLQTLGFDKTGTLTEGKFEVTDIACAEGFDERETLRLAAAIEIKTSHPLAAGIVSKFSGCVAEMVQSQTDALPPVTCFQLHEGRGISGEVEGKRVQIGNREFLRLVGGALTGDMDETYGAWSRDSKTVVFVCVDGTLAMMMSLADSIRPNSLAALEMLRGIGVQTAMITGDNAQTAAAVRSKLGLDQCVAEMKPHEKLGWIKDNQELSPAPDGIREQTGACSAVSRCWPCARRRPLGVVGMVGDGVNDGPALAAANVGIAMGAGGTALAVEAADVALMSNNLTKIPELVLLGRFCRSVVRQNIAFSVLLKLLIVGVALAGKAALWMAVLADVVGLLCVILNGLRPLWWKANPAEPSKRTSKLRFGGRGRAFVPLAVV